jgi:hypothetical protein
VEKIDSNLYKQNYFCEDFFSLVDIEETETARLMTLDVFVVHYELGVTNEGEVSLFYLTLYFKSISNKELDFNKLFDNYKNN